MNSRRPGPSETYGRGSHRGSMRGGARPRHIRQSNDRDTGDSHIAQQLHLILDVEADVSFHWRISHANQVVGILNESRTPGQHQHDHTSLLHACLFRHNVRQLLQSGAPSPLKRSLSKLFALLGGLCHSDMLFSWLCDQLNQWKDGDPERTSLSEEVDWKTWLWHTLRQAIVDSTIDPQSRQETMSLVLKNMLSFLDAMDTSDYLPIMLDTFDAVASHYKDEFHMHFTDLIDLLVGWYIDLNLPESKRVLIEAFYKKHTLFWRHHLRFAQKLLQELLMDLPSFLKESRDSCTYMLRCYLAILEVALPLSARENHSPEWSSLCNDTLKFLFETRHVLPDKVLSEKSYQMVMSLTAFDPQHLRYRQWEIYQFFVSELSEKNAKVAPMKLVQDLIIVVNSWAPSIDPSVISHLLDKSASPLFILRNKARNDKKLGSATSTFIRVLIRYCDEVTRPNVSQQWITHFCKKMARIEEPHPIKRYPLSLSNSLESPCRETHHTSASKRTSSLSATKTVQEFLFYTYILLDAASVWPSLRKQHVETVLQLFCLAWDHQCDTLVDTLIQMLSAFWSSWPISNEDSDLFVCLVHDMTRYWTRINLKTRQVLCELVEHALARLSDLDPVQCQTLIQGLLQASEYERNTAVTETIIRLAVQQSETGGSGNILASALNRLDHSLHHPSPSVQQWSKQLLGALSPFMAAAEGEYPNTSITRMLQVIMMASPHTGSFRPAHFEIMMKLLGMTNYLIGSKEAIRNINANDDTPAVWTRRAFHHCDALGSMKHVPSFEGLREVMDISNITQCINHCTHLTAYWTIWEVTRYCILSRLRTPFGGPQQTFAAFEHVLNTLTSDSGERDESASERLRHLLLLLDRLELQIYNASDGCATSALPSVPRSSLVFFRTKTNKKTCQDYFTRIRPKMILGAKQVYNDTFLIRHTLEILSERETMISSSACTDPLAWFREVNDYLKDIVEACIRQNHVDLIVGLQSWYKRVIKTVAHVLPSFSDEWKFEGLIGPLSKKDKNVEDENNLTPWFQVAALFASGQSEAAIRALQQLCSLLVSDDFGIMDMLNKQALNVYTCLENYDSIKNLCATRKHLFSDLVVNALEAFTTSDEHVSQYESADIQSVMMSAPLDLSLQLGRLSKFHAWIGDTETTNELLKKKVIRSLNDNLLYNRNNLLEYQILQCTSDKMIMDGVDWHQSRARSRHHHLDTNYWNRLTTRFEQAVVSHGGAVPCISTIQLQASRAARKQGNLATSGQWLDKATAYPLMTNEIRFQRAKIFLAQSNLTAAMEMLNSLLVDISDEKGFEKLESKSFLKITRLLKSAATCSNADQASNLLNKLEPRLLQYEPSAMVELQSPIEQAVDTAFQKSVEKATVWAKPWFEYATHHYKQGWRIFDDMTRPNSVLPVVRLAREKINALIAQSSTPSDPALLEKDMLRLLQQHSGVIGSPSLRQDTNFVDALKLLLGTTNATLQDSLLEVLDTLQSSIVSRFRMSVEAYFCYLTFVRQNDQVSSETGDKGSRSTSMLITATLRLLRLLVKYGNALSDVYSAKVDQVPIEPWKSIIPQLFSRLNHPTEFVRQIISTLLGRICDQYPREIIYDIIVSSTSSKTNGDTKQALDMIANRIVATNGDLWVSTRRMAEELEKITVLWEEKWLNRIASLQFDVMQQFSKLDREIIRMKQADWTDEHREQAFYETYVNVMRFVVISIEKVLATTVNDGAKTPHEQWFVSTFGKQLDHAFGLLQRPESIKSYRKGWDCFQQLHRLLLAETQKVRVLELAQVSPFLAEPKATTIGIPGIHNDQVSCFIETFGTTVIVLPTKTKPKKLDLRGTDGKIYSYLFKGLEDLHLDERIMQLLNTMNGLLGEDRAAAVRKLKARTYAVIPLSDHSGMIQWVNDATPLFALYKRWQKRESAAQMLFAEKPNEPADVLPRPTEGFMDKVATSLKAEGLRVSANRRHWPKHILNKVYRDLVKETPSDLVSRELWCSSSDTAEWLSKTVSFSRSLAVMSMLGYIIGLGDRHLDNMMVDYWTGEMIHIDYNVCFEKGKRLRVPETVPYRLTQNLLHALGITGVDGVFRTAAEETLRVLRKHKEVLITLLDAFVYDPLVDWASEGGEAEERRIMELQANVTLVATRLNDQKRQYEEQQHTIEKMITQLKTRIQDAYYSAAADQAVEEASDEESENESKETQVEKAKQRLLVIRDTCSTWRAKHEEILVMMKGSDFKTTLDTFRDLAKDICHIPYDDASQSVSLKERLTSWLTQRETVYAECLDELNVYSDLVKSVDSKKLASQDICDTLVSVLEPWVQQGYPQNDIGTIQTKLEQPECSLVLQNVESRAVGFVNYASQYLVRVHDLLKKNKRHALDSLGEQLMAESKPSLAEALAQHLSVLETAFQRFNAEEYDTSDEPMDTSSAISKEQVSLERKCHFGCFSQQQDFECLMSLTCQLPGFTPILQRLITLDSEDQKLLSLLPKSASAVYLLENTCLSLCNIVFKEHQTAADTGSALLAELRRANLEKTILQQDQATRCSEKAGELFKKLQAPFKVFDEMCEFARNLATGYHVMFENIQSAVDTFLELKQLVMTSLLQEVVKHYKSEPSYAWVPPQVRLWSIACNPALSQSLNTMVSALITTIHLPLAAHVATNLREKLTDFLGASKNRVYHGDDSASIEKTVSTLRRVLEERARQAVLDVAGSIQRQFEQEGFLNQQELARFQWFNASLIQSNRPLVRSEILGQISSSQEQIHRVRASLRALGDLFAKPGERMSREALDQWKDAFDEEMRKCDTLMRIYTTLDHFEALRQGNSKAIILQKEVEDNLHIMNSATTDATANPDASMASLRVPLNVVQHVQEGLTKTGDIVKELESHVDGIAPLLESVVIIEMDADSELRPAQESAKLALELMVKIKSQLQMVTEHRQQEKARRATPWTFAQLLDDMAALENDVQELYRHLRTLDSFGLDNRTNEEAKRDQADKMASSDHEESTTNPAEDDELHREGDQDVSASGGSIDIDLDHVEGTKSDAREVDHQSLTSHGLEPKKPAQVTSTLAAPHRNKHVLGIMRRVRHKLEGHDFGVAHTMGVAEQVAMTIEQATLPDNLCVMYEGWTSWV